MGAEAFNQFLLTNSSKERVRRWDNRSKSDYFYTFLKVARNLFNMSQNNLHCCKYNFYLNHMCQ